VNPIMAIAKRKLVTLKSMTNLAVRLGLSLFMKLPTEIISERLQTVISPIIDGLLKSGRNAKIEPIVLNIIKLVALRPRAFKMVILCSIKCRAKRLCVSRC
jgi:hypothetical protein